MFVRNTSNPSCINKGYIKKSDCCVCVCVYNNHFLYMSVFDRWKTKQFTGASPCVTSRWGCCATAAEENVRQPVPAPRKYVY